MSLFRIDRFLSLLVFGPCRRLIGSSGIDALPILMYHSISEDAERGVGAYYKVATSPGRFAEQMEWLAEKGYEGVSLEEALTRSDFNSGNARRPVAITFDDGFFDYYTDAWPVLKRHGFSATMFLATGLIGPEGFGFLGRRCLSWNEIRELRTQGTCFGSHSVNHPHLYTQSWERIRTEIEDSKKRIEAELGENITTFSYPYSYPQGDTDFTRKFESLLKQCGYASNLTTKVGRFRKGDDLFSIRRLPINQQDDHDLFIAKLNGSYDWLGTPQKWLNVLSKTRMFRVKNSGAVQTTRDY